MKTATKETIIPPIRGKMMRGNASPVFVVDALALEPASALIPSPPSFAPIIEPKLFVPEGVMLDVVEKAVTIPSEDELLPDGVCPLSNTTR